MKKIILAAIALLLAVHIYAQVPVINVTNDFSRNRIVVEFSMPTYRIADTNIYDVYGINQTYKYIHVNNDDFGIIDSIGLPELPKITTLLAIPNNATITSVTASDLRWVNRTIGGRIYPNQEYSREGTVNQFVINNQYYNSGGDAIFNGGYFFDETFVAFGQKGLAFTVLPFAYSPVQNLIRELSYGTFFINYTIDASKSNVDQYTSDVREDYLSQMFSNYIPSPQKGSVYRGRLLIITPQCFLSEITYFANYRRNVGFQVDVITLEQIAALGIGIKDCIQQRYNYLPYRPDFVLLVGDTYHIPPASGNPSGEDENNPITDFWYTTLEGSDWFADVHLGRWPVDYDYELVNIINKTLQMEMFMHNYDKVANFVSGYYDQPRFENLKNETHDKVIKEAFGPAGFFCNKLYQPEQSIVNVSLNNNPLYYIYSGHGNVSSMAITNYQSNTINLGLYEAVIRNAKNTVFPIVFGFACQTGNFADREYYSLAEELIRPEKGGIAYFGASINTLTLVNPIIEKHILIESFLNNQNLGSIINSGKKSYYKRFFKIESNVRRNIKAYNLFGDPCFLKSGIGQIDEYIFINQEAFPYGAKVSYQAMSKIQNDNSFVINSYAEVELKSQGSISLKPGFHAVRGAKFSAKIGNIATGSPSNKSDIVTLSGDDDNIVGLKGDNMVCSVYPNPVVDNVRFNIQSYNDDYANVNIYDVNGGLVITHCFAVSKSDNNEVVLNLSDCKAGIFFYRVILGECIFTGKIIKK